MKTIVVLSTEPWGKMWLSKMHYAVELSQMGHDVYFVNPPKNLANKKLVVRDEQRSNNITILETKAIRGNLFLLFKLFAVYRKLSERYVRGIQKQVGKKIDEVWCFDPHTYVDLAKFNAGITLLFLYDFYKGKHVFKAASSADALITVSHVILEHYKEVSTPKLLLQHGLGNAFAQQAYGRIHQDNFHPNTGTIRVGYVGNLLREGMDISLFRTIIEQHPEIEFNIWGPYSHKENNVTVQDAILSTALLNFIQFLQEQQNVVLHGVTEQHVLAKEINNMDAFLFLYSATNDMNKASNSHKILEYLSTGKVIVSTYVSAHRDNDIVTMVAEQKEQTLPELFERVMKNLGDYNSAEKQRSRIDFALANTYKNQVGRIHQFAYKGSVQ